MAVVGIRGQENLQGIEAGEALSQYRAVVVFTDGKAYKPGTKTTSHFAGVTVDELSSADFSAGKNLIQDLQYSGICLLEAAGVISIGDYVTYDTNGKGVKFTQIVTNLSDVNCKVGEIIGICQEASAANTDVIAVELRPMIGIQAA